jgi:hypothetical protein
MRLRDYLSPRPLRTDNYEHWEAIKSRGHSLTDEETVISLFRLVMKDLDLASEPLELALVIVEAFRQSCCKRENDAVIKLFRFKKAIMAQKIFHDWFRHALEILEGYQKAGTSLDGTIALFLVLSIVDLIADFKIVKSADTLAKLKDERGVDWDSILIEVSADDLFILELSLDSSYGGLLFVGIHCCNQIEKRLSHDGLHAGKVTFGRNQGPRSQRFNLKFTVPKRPDHIEPSKT